MIRTSSRSRKARSPTIIATPPVSFGSMHCGCARLGSARRSSNCKVPEWLACLTHPPEAVNLDGRGGAESFAGARMNDRLEDRTGVPRGFLSASLDAQAPDAETILGGISDGIVALDNE